MNVPANNDDGVTVEITNKMPDSRRQNDERTALVDNRQMNFYAAFIGEELANFIKKSVQKIDRVDVAATKTDLTKNEEGKYNGTIRYAVRVLHAGQTKDTPITIVCKDGKNEMPSADALNAELDTIKGNEDKAAEADAAKGAAEKKAMAELADTLITKEASAGPVAGGTLAPVLHVDKTWLPASLKSDDMVSIDGVRYVITGDDHNKLSAASDGAFWTLRIVDESHTPDAKRTKHMLI